MKFFINIFGTTLILSDRQKMQTFPLTFCSNFLKYLEKSAPRLIHVHEKNDFAEVSND